MNKLYEVRGLVCETYIKTIRVEAVSPSHAVLKANNEGITQLHSVKEIKDDRIRIKKSNDYI
jgi:hypothetical protein